MSCAVTEKFRMRNYFWCMDRSLQFLMGNDVSQVEGATIHLIVPPTPEASDDDKIGFTLDVSMRLDQEQSEHAVVVPIAETPQDLADSA